MMCKARRTVLLLAVLLVAICLPHTAARAEVQRLLVLHDVEGDGPGAANLEEVRRMMTTGGYRCDYLPAWQEASLDNCDAVIVVAAQDRPMNEETAYQLRKGSLPVFVVGDGPLAQLARTVTAEGSVVVRTRTEGGSDNDILLNRSSITLLDGENAVIGGRLYVDSQAYPLCKTVGKITHMAYCNAEDPALAAALCSYLQAWMWPYRNEPTAYGQYLVLDNVYPFFEPEDLMAVTDMLEEEGVPYAVCVMPIYDNADYPAMKRFCEWLRYIQSRGAGIVLHTPLVSLDRVNMETYLKQLETAYGAYTRYGVYPVALKAPEAYVYSKRGLDALRGFRTVLLYSTDDQLSDREDGENLAWYDGHQLIAPYTQGANAITTAYPQAIYLDVNEDVESLRGFVQTLKRSRRALKSLVDMDHSVYIGSSYMIRTRLGTMEANGAPVSLAYEPFEYEQYRFDRGFGQYMTQQIQTSNKAIMTFVLVASTFFAIAIILSRRAMRRAILHPVKYRKPSVPKRKGGDAECI